MTPDAGPTHNRSAIPYGMTLERHRLLFQGGVDCVAWVIGLASAMVLRYEFELDPDAWGPFSLGSLLLAVVVAAVLQLAAGLANGVYLGRYRYGSFDEVKHLFRSVFITSALLAVGNNLLSDHLVPTSVCFAGGVFALGVMAGFRYCWRLVLDKRMRPSSEAADPVLVFGAGEGGVQVVTAMLRNPQSPYVPVGLVDDDPAKRNLRIMGVPVVGPRESLAREAERLGADTVVIAVPSANAALLRELSDLALDAELRVRVLPPIDELFGQSIGVGDLRPLTERDLLGRHEIDTDIDAIAGYLTGRRVLVTGAGGSIGNELCFQIARFAPDQLVMLDRDESALHGVQLRLEGRAMLDSRNLVVCDIRDPERLDEVFAEHRPEVVFHAAALKHLPLLEMHPEEALKTNVIGTQNVLDAARLHTVERFVNISTDKAADPISVLGFTKRIAEKLTAAAATTADGTYLSVRFGNVLGSRGSVLTAFRAQIQAGGPVTVTDPEVTRYFMTIEEAVQLVIQAGAIGRDGEALVLDMGEPVKIDDVARRLVAEADRPVDIVYTGLRPGEKLHEVLLGSHEVDERTSHPLISHVAVPTVDLDTVLHGTGGRRGSGLTACLAELANGAGAEPADPPAGSQAGTQPAESA